ncbi:MAG: sulfatase-like hydrolase/transferase [Pseudomonadota bacterium]
MPSATPLLRAAQATVPARMLLTLLCAGILSACYHPLQIVGQGDIVSSNGQHDCTWEEQYCDNLVEGDYTVTYTAVPRPGWTFVRWENCNNQFPECSFDVPGSAVSNFAGLTLVPLQAVFEPVTPQPNILLLIADDISYDHYGFTGHPLVQTPTIDAMAGQSLRYPNVYVSSHCRPTLAALLTGLADHNHGVTYVLGPKVGVFSTLPERLVNAGYSTYQAGKFWEASPLGQGFTDFMPFTDFTGNLDLGRVTMSGVQDFIAQTNSPWFIWFAPLMPHTPHTAPASYRTPYENQGLDEATIEYYAMISWFDDVVDDVLQEVGPDTVVVYLADNGYVQSSVSEEPTLRSKTSLYEKGVRTELLIRYPSASATIDTSLAGVPDVVTTVLNIAGAYSGDLPGRDLLATPPTVTRAFGSLFSLGLANPIGTLWGRFVREGDWKLIDSETGPDELFHLPSDPNERVNLINDPNWPTLESDLRVELEAWWAM